MYNQPAKRTDCRSQYQKCAAHKNCANTCYAHSGAYAARHVAKNIVAAGLAPVAEVELCYAIGVSQPVSVQVDTRGTAVVSEEVITDWVREHVDLSPDGIINRFELRRPIYKQVAAYGHFGRPELDLPWEKLDLVDALRADFKEYLKD